jgi:hypothetical protein
MCSIDELDYLLTNFIEEFYAKTDMFWNEGGAASKMQQKPWQQKDEAAHALGPPLELQNHISKALQNSAPQGQGGREGERRTTKRPTLTISPTRAATLRKGTAYPGTNQSMKSSMPKGVLKKSQTSLKTMDGSKPEKHVSLQP